MSKLRRNNGTKLEKIKRTNRSKNTRSVYWAEIWKWRQYIPERAHMCDCPKAPSCFLMTVMSIFISVKNNFLNVFSLHQSKGFMTSIYLITSAGYCDHFIKLLCADLL